MTPTISSLLGWCVIAAGALLLAAALFKDRSRGRRRCPRCWYDMGGVPGLVCPECGRRAGAERRLFRTRRRWKRAVMAGVVMLAGWGTTAIPKLRHGWERLIPTTALVLIADAVPRSAGPVLPLPGALPTLPARAPRSGSGGAAPASLPARERLTNETWTRILSGQVWTWQSQHFLSRVLREATVHPEQLVTVPTAWPADEPLHILLEVPAILSDRDFNVDARAQASAWCAPVRSGAANEGNRRIGPLTTDAIELRIRHGTVTVWTATLNPPIRIRGTLDTFLDRITDSDAAVQAALRPRLTQNDHDNWVVEYHERDTSDLWSGIDYGIDFRAEVVVAGRAVGRTVGMVVWGQSDWPSPTEALLVFEDAGREALETALASLNTPVLLRITGAPDRAGLSYINHPFNKPRPACWAGAFEIRVSPPGPAPDPQG